MTTYQQEMVLSYIKTYTGKKFFVTEPRAEDVCIEDIAHSLSRQSRYSGHTREKFYSVAEHSMYCSYIAKKIGCDERIQLIALLHDSSEGYCSDVVRPLKQVLPQYKEAEDKIMSVIWDAFDLHPSEEEYHIIKKIDNTILLMELEQLMYVDKEDCPDVEVFDFKSFDITEEFSMDAVKIVFLDMFKLLTEGDK